MAIYRGPGGSGDATADSANTAQVAETFATQAGVSAAAAAASATTASNAATAAGAAQTAAEAAQTAAELAETNAETAETNAETAQTAAEAARDAALAAQTAAELAETNAETAETNAETAQAAAEAAQLAAETAQTAAELAETNAETAETGALAAQAAAESARDSALAAYDNFDDRYLGAKTSDPTLDNDGNALVAGALYFNSVDGAMRVYTGSVWVDAYAAGQTFLAKANNLSDLTNVATARQNLDLEIGVDVQAFDATILKSADIGSSVQAYDSNLTSFVSTFTLPTTDGTTGQVLSTNGSGTLSFQDVGSGDVVGPASATDNSVSRFDGTTGKLIQNSAVTIADDGTTVISANSTTNALRITQTGTGNALLVEDSANPDSTPFVIDASGRTLIGYGVTNTYQAPGKLQVTGTTDAHISIGRFTDNGTPPSINFNKSRSTDPATRTVLQPSDDFGTIVFAGDDGTSFITGAQILAEVDGTPDTNDMPGRLVFFTTADGASTPTERMRIDSAGNVGIGGTGAASTKVTVTGTLPSSSSTSRGFSNLGVAPTSSTTAYQSFFSNPSTADGITGLTALSHFSAVQGTITGGTRVAPTNQYGFISGATLTGATNNYGFYSDIASGTGRWNFYANGTADNYFAGQVQLGAGTVSAPALSTTGDTNTGIFFPAADTIAFAEGGAEAMRIDSSGNVGIGTTSPGTRMSLQLSSATTYTTSTRTNQGLTIYNSSPTTNQFTGIEFSGEPTSGNGGFAGIGSVVTGGGSAALVFGTRDSSTYAERVRITSGGQFLVGATSASTPANSTSYIVSQGDFSSVGGVGFGMSVASTTGTGEDHYYISFQTATTTQRGYIYYNNGAGQVQLSATSDARLKENIVGAPSALPVLEQVKVRQYDWKETGNTNIGFVAQELYEVIPRAVAVGQDAEDGSIQRAWGVDNASLVPYLVKAIQELKAINDAQASRIETLEAKVAALENA